MTIRRIMTIYSNDYSKNKWLVSNDLKDSVQLQCHIMMDTYDQILYVSWAKSVLPIHKLRILSLGPLWKQYIVMTELSEKRGKGRGKKEIYHH